VKRDSNDIKDDQIYLNKSGNKSFCAKVIRNYKSNVSCLPGKFINDEKKLKTRLVLPKKFETNKIFDVLEKEKCALNNSFTYAKSARKPDQVLNYFEITKKEKDLFENTKKSKRPSGIKNAFASQLRILK
jgi:hypothetical protein